MASDELPTTDEKSETASIHRKQGGWFTLPFITGSMLCLTIASSGWVSNLTVYLITEFNVNSINATKITNVVNGCTGLFPIAGAIIADSLFGCFSVISISSFISLLGIILLTLTATIHSLKPPLCMNGSNTCETPSKVQFGVLYVVITLLCIGLGGTRFTLATMGANQFNKVKHQGIFFNWYFVSLYAGFAFGFTIIVYLQDNIGWSWGYAVCIILNVIAIVVFLTGKKYYRHIVPQRSPFTPIARVLVACMRNRKVGVTQNTDYYHGQDHSCNDDDGGKKTITLQAPTSSLRFLNRATLKVEGSTRSYGSVVNPWKLCTVKQVEDLKTLIKILPLWSTSIFLTTPVGILNGLSVLQALTMDRHLGPKFKIPAGSFLVFSILSAIISLSIVDRLLIPTWHKLTCRSLTPLQRVGIGHVFNIITMASAAIVESRRLHVVRSNHLETQPGSIVPMSALWLVIPLNLVGIGEAFQFPGQVGLYYQEFPVSLRSTSTAMISLLIAIGFYLSTAMIDLVQRVTGWLPDNINNGRLDNVYWMLVVIGVVNFGYYLTCATMYKYQNVEEDNSSVRNYRLAYFPINNI